MQKSTLREYLESILIAAILALFIRTFVFQAFKIPTGSMEPNLLVGDHIVVNKFIFGDLPGDGWFFLPTREISRGDVIVFRAPQEPDEDFIKRVIAVGGDKVEIRDGVVRVNDEIVDDPHASYTSSYGSRRNYEPTVVPAGHYFCLGDNRDNSRDSRYWGTVPASMVKGRAVLIYWSFEAPSMTVVDSGVVARLTRVGRLIPRFFTDTRWNRTLRMIR